MKQFKIGRVFLAVLLSLCVVSSTLVQAADSSDGQEILTEISKTEESSVVLESIEIPEKEMIETPKLDDTNDSVDENAPDEELEIPDIPVEEEVIIETDSSEEKEDEMDIESVNNEGSLLETDILQEDMLPDRTEDITADQEEPGALSAESNETISDEYTKTGSFTVDLDTSGVMPLSLDNGSAQTVTNIRYEKFATTYVSTVSNPQLSIGIKYIPADANNADGGGRMRVMYCIEFLADSPLGENMTFSKWMQNAKILYALYNGVMYYGEPSRNPNYRTDDWKMDYFVTQIAIHVLNGEYTLAAVNKSINQSSATGAEKIMAYQRIEKLVNDASNSANYSNITNDRTWVDLQDLTFNLNRTDGTFSLSNGYYITSGDHYKASLTTSEGYDMRPQIISYNIVPDAGLTVVKDNAARWSDFYVRTTTSQYNEWRKTGKTVNVAVQAYWNRYWGAAVYAPGAGSGAQSVTMLVANSTLGNVYQTKYIHITVPSLSAKVTITKKDSITDERLSGATFNLYEWNGSSYSVKKGALTETTTGIYEMTGLKYTDANKGKFKVVEEKNPTGYTDTWSKEFAIDINGSLDQTFNYTVTNTPFKGTVTVIKTDSVTGERLTGAEFRCYAWDGSAYEEDLGPLKDNGDGTYSGTYNYTKINRGYFLIREEKNPTGYTGSWRKNMIIDTSGESSQTFTFDVTNTSFKGTVKVTKTDSVTGEKLTGAEFRCYAWDGSAYGEDLGLLKDNGDGTYTGTYNYTRTNRGYFWIVEEKYPTGYTGYWGEVVRIDTSGESAQTFTYDVTNTPFKGTVKVTKTDSLTGEKLTGAKFRCYAWDGDDYGEDLGLLKDNGDGTYSGTYNYTKTNRGYFWIVEEKYPTGYTGYWGEVVRIDTSGKSTQTFTYDVTNTPFKGTVKVTKTDSLTGKKLTGAKFRCYAWDGAEYTVDKGLLTDNGDGTYTGNYYYNNDNLGKFKIIEEDNPDGYTGIWSSTFVISANGSSTQVFTYDVTNTPFKGIVMITKEDSVTGEKLTGAKFRCYAWDGAEYTVDKGLLKDNGDGTYTGTYYYDSVNQGKYKIVETDNPSGYTGDWSDRFVISADGASSQHFTYYVKNTKAMTKATIYLNKIDKATGKPLAGAEFSVYEWDSEANAYSAEAVQVLRFDSMTMRYSTETPLVRSSMNEGKFLIRETKPPEGYIGTWEKEIMLDGSSEEVTYNFTAENIRSVKLTINKTIHKDDIWWAHGEPAFIFSVTGNDINGKTHCYHKIVTFTKEYVETHIAADGTITLSTVIEDIPSGSYSIEEVQVSRFVLTNVTAQTDNILIKKEEKNSLYENIIPITADVSADLTESDGEVTFFNRKITWDRNNHSDTVINNFEIDKQ